ncbi:hypothetical protein N865_18865 [Intrasporangium oryzae NRRL B-24470]|uniref:YCII-related domain-containing protein n=1 Tax=Intrasporangium oryzae NRRL B-24470 TaxID=1386089 RepID=W9GB26_9MICO|nr:YciI family protein [Intrasporangium oryzae]EWT03285.1 hypothetical protein N865_18865 [Intrasporangium oryzae NRRL B-24470]
MTDTYAYLIHEPDWDSDAYLEGGDPALVPSGRDANFPEHKAFQVAVADLGARVVGGAALHNSRHGGTVKPGAGEGAVEDAVWTDGPFADTSEVITGFYLVEIDDEDTARRVAAMVPTRGHVEWRKVFPMQ